MPPEATDELSQNGPALLTLKHAAAVAGVTTERIRELLRPRPTHPLPSYLEGRPLAGHQDARGRWRVDAADLGARVVPNTRPGAAERRRRGPGAVADAIGPAVH